MQKYISFCTKKKFQKNSKKIPTQLKKTDTLKKEGANFEKSEKKIL